MVGFARAKAKSIFSNLRFTTIVKVENKTHERKKVKKLDIKNERNGNYFLEAIQNGGIWLS